MSKNPLYVLICAAVLCLLGGASRASAQCPPKTTVSDTLYNADGTLASGRVVIAWTTFQIGPCPVIAGQLSVAVSNGALSVQLYPSDSATPAGTSYRVTYHLKSGKVATEYWVVPTSGAPVSLATVRSPTVPVPTVMFSMAQVTNLIPKLDTKVELPAVCPAGKFLQSTGGGTPPQVTCVDGTGAPLASPSQSGTVKTDASEADPRVYVKTTMDTLLAAKAPLSHSHTASDITSGVLDGARLPAPTSATLGGIKSGSCAGSDKVSGVSTAGEILCAPDQTGGGSSQHQVNGANLTANDPVNFQDTATVAASNPTGGIVQFLVKDGAITATKLNVSNPTAGQLAGLGDANVSPGALSANRIAGTAVVQLRTINTSLPLTGGGDLSADRTISFAAQPANRVLAGPASGPDGVPAFRLLADSDVPDNLSLTNLTQIATRNYNDLQNRTHELVGSDHAASGLTSGHVLRATGAATFAFGALQTADLPATTVDALSKLSNGLCSDGQIIKKVTGAWACAADDAGGGSAHNLLSNTHTDTTAGTVARGDLVVGQGVAPSWQRLAIGAANTYLGSNGTDATWTAPTGSGSVLGTGRTLTGGAGITAIGDLSTDRTISFDSAELNTLTWGDGSLGSFTWTFNVLTGTDPVLTLGNGVFNISTGTLQQGGTAVVLTTRTLTGGTGITAIGDLSADRTIAVDSNEPGFVSATAVSCGAGTAGRIGNTTTTLEWCDTATTPALKRAALGDSAGAATALAANTVETADIQANAVTVAKVATVLATRQIIFILGADNTSAPVLVDADDQASIYVNRLGQGITITEVWCESDAGTPSINLQRDDGTPANILSANLSCSTSGATGTIDAAEDNVANTERIDFVMVAAGGTARRITLAIKFTID